MSEGKKRYGFLGAGRMAQALSKGFIAGGVTSADCIIASDVEPGALTFIEKDCGVRVTTDNTEVVRNADVIIIAVKPHIVAPALKEVAPHVTKDHLAVSIAAGITLQTLEQLLPEGTRVVRVVPNTPALVGCGTSGYSLGTHTLKEDGALVERMFSSVGISAALPERLIDAVTGLSGSGPAYLFVAIEAMSDGGVRMGLPRDIATRFAAQTVLGAAKMVLETGKHPGELKDAVCSPGGTTIAAVHTLEKGGYRAALIDAVQAATLKSEELGKN